MTALNSIMSIIEHEEGKVVGIKHFFGNGVKVRADLKDRMVRRYHGEVLVAEFVLNPVIDVYMKLLMNINDEMQGMRQESESQ